MQQLDISWPTPNVLKTGSSLVINTTKASIKGDKRPDDQKLKGKGKMLLVLFSLVSFRQWEAVWSTQIYNEKKKKKKN